MGLHYTLANPSRRFYNIFHKYIYIYIGITIPIYIYGIGIAISNKFYLTIQPIKLGANCRWCELSLVRIVVGANCRGASCRDAILMKYIIE